MKGTLHNHVIGICGDLKYGRTVQSLITAMSRYENIKFVLISPKELRIPQYIRQEVLDKNNIEYCEVEKIEEHIDEIVRLAASCNLTKQDIIEMINFSLEEQ